MAYYGVGRWQDAITELKAYKRISGRPDQNHLIADSLRGLGRPMEAVPLADEMLRGSACPRRGEGRGGDRRGLGASGRRRFAEALGLLARAKTREDVAQDYTLRLWYVRGDVLARAGRPDEAAAEFRKVMRHDRRRSTRRSGWPRSAERHLVPSALRQ
jgi:hypothetical protein